MVHSQKGKGGQQRPVAELVAEFPKRSVAELRKRLPKGTRFRVAKDQTKKYTAVIPSQEAGGGRDQQIDFGSAADVHYKDRVPKDLGGGKWSHKDHGDEQRRWRYWSRHSGIKRKDGRKAVEVPLTAAWFSAHFLW